MHYYESTTALESFVYARFQNVNKVGMHVSMLAQKAFIHVHVYTYIHKICFGRVLVCGDVVAVAVAVHDTIADAWRRHNETTKKQPQRTQKQHAKHIFHRRACARTPHAQTKASNRRLLSARACCTRACMYVHTSVRVCVSAPITPSRTTAATVRDGHGETGGIWNDDQRAKRAPHVCPCVHVCVRLCACACVRVCFRPLAHRSV